MYEPTLKMVETISNTDSLTRTFYYIVQVFKVFGLQPLSATHEFKADNRHTINYSFTFKSFAFMLSLIYLTTKVGVWSLFLWEMFGYGTTSIFVTRTQNYSYSFQPIDFAQFSVQLLLPIGMCVNEFIILFTSHSFATYLNNWTEFETQMQNTFNLQFPDNLTLFSESSKFRKHLLKLLVLVSVLLLGTTVPAIKSQAGLTPSVDSFNPITAGPLGYLTFLVFFLIDMRSCLMFRCSEEAFKKINQNIDRNLKSFSFKLNLESVQNWQNVLSLAKQQLNLSGRIQSRNILVEVIFSCSMWVGVAFQVIMLVQKEGGILTSLKLVLPSALFVLAMYSRLIIKMRFAQKSEIQEAKLTSILRLANFSKLDLETFIETTSMIDRIELLPSRINIANLFILNQTLLLNMFGQVTTYLLVLFQFQNAEDAKNAE